MDHSLSLYDVRSMTKMAICVALLCVSAYISFPVPFASAMVTALLLFVVVASEPWLIGFLLFSAYLLSGPFYTFLVLPRRAKLREPLQELS